MLIPNPFYAAYSAGAVAAGCEPVYLPATQETGFLPDLDALAEELLGAHRRVLSSLRPRTRRARSPTEAYLTRLVALARRFGFLMFSRRMLLRNLYSTAARRTACCEAAGPDFTNVVVFQSLSKRSNLPGLRVGFAAGDRAFLARFLELRNVAAPQVPVPAQQVAIAAYGDEAHVEENRGSMREIRSRRSDHRRSLRLSAAGRRLLPLARRLGRRAATRRWRCELWRDGGLRVIPGRYLARDGADGSNPGHGYIRVAMVQDNETTAEALHRLVAVLG